MSNRFHYRSFIAFGLFMVIIWLLVTGTVLYITPPGRVAHWQHWTLLGLSKEQWQAQHTLFSYLFVILAIWHIFFLNWRNLWSYVKLRTNSNFRKKKEFVLAVLLMFIVFFGTHLQLPPFSSFYNLGEDIGFSWEEKQYVAPVPHTEILSLREVADTYLKQDVNEVMDKLEKAGIVVKSPDEILGEIAIANDKTPAEIYAIVAPPNIQNRGSGLGDKRSSDGAGKGYGRMTVEEMASDMGIGIDEVIGILKDNGIEASADETLKDIAGKYGRHPSELVQMIIGDY